MPIDLILQDKKLAFILKQMFDMYLNPNFFVDILINLLDKIDVIAILLITIPGATCYTIGYRIAAFTRFLFSIIYIGK